MAETKKRQQKRSLLFAVLLILVYFITRYAVPMLYTPEWAARNMYPYIALLLFAAFICKKERFALTAFSGYLLGLLFGEVFGGYESHIPPQFLHHGWWIFLLTFLISCIIGLFLQKRYKKSSSA